MAMFLARLPASRLRTALQESKGRSIPGLQNDIAFGNKEKEDSNEAGMSFQEGLIDYGFALDCGACGGADVTGDGDVNYDDLSEVVGNWLVGVGP
jgi:hypothetical protein